MRGGARIAVLLWLLLTSFYALTGAGHSTFGDGYLVLQMARSILDHGTLAIAPLPGAGNMPLRVGRDGRLYQAFAPGQAFAEMPAIILGRVAAFVDVQVVGEPVDPARRDEFFAVLTNAWVTATTVTLVFAAGIALGFSRGLSLTNATSLAIASPLWCYARTDGSEALQAMFLFAAALAFFDRRFASPARQSFAAGLLLALAVISKLVLVIVVPCFLWICWRAGAGGDDRRLRSAALLTPVLAGILLYGLYDAARFGNPLDLGYRAGPLLFWGSRVHGSFALLFSASFGLLLFWPAFLLVPFGIRPLAEANRGAALLAGAIPLTLLVVYAGHRPELQFAWGPRWLVPTIPLLSLFVLAALARTGRLLRAAFVATAIVGTLIEVVTAGASWWHQVYGVQMAVRSGGRVELNVERDLAPLRVGAWWLELVATEQLEGPATASLRLLHPPWEDRFPWRSDDSVAQELWDLRGLDLWAAAASWRMPYRPIGRNSAGLSPIPSSVWLRRMLIIVWVAASAALISALRTERRCFMRAP